MANYNYDFWAKEHEWKSGGMKDRQLTNRAIDQAMAERRLLTDRTRAEQDRQLKRNIMNYNMGKAITKDMNDLYIPGDSGAGGFDAIIQDTSRNMADYAAHLAQEVQRTGDYATYAREMAKLKGQVGDIKALKGDAVELMTTFNSMNEDGTLSNYVSADLRAALMDMQSSDPSGSFQNIDGKEMWVGETVTGKPYQFALSEMKNLKNKLVAKQDVDTIIDGAMKVQTTPSGNILGFYQGAPGLDGSQGMSAADYALDALDDTLDQNPENRHRLAGALLTDNFGYTEDQAKALLDKGWDTAYGVLQREWVDKAQSLYGINSKAVQSYHHAAKDQEMQHWKEDEQRKKLKDDRIATERAFNNPNDPRIWNVDLQDFAPQSIQGYSGFMDRIKGDLGMIGIDTFQVAFGPDIVVDSKVSADGKEVTEAYTKQGKPTGIYVQNSINPNGKPFYIPFNVGPKEMQNLIRQAQGINTVGSRYNPGSLTHGGYKITSGPRAGERLPNLRGTIPGTPYPNTGYGGEIEY